MRTIVSSIAYSLVVPQKGPFFVAEAYTDTPGEFVAAEETVKDFKELLEGQYDDLPEQAFYFVGGIDEAVAKSHTSLS